VQPDIAGVRVRLVVRVGGGRHGGGARLGCSVVFVWQVGGWGGWLSGGAGRCVRGEGGEGGRAESRGSGE